MKPNVAGIVRLSGIVLIVTAVYLIANGQELLGIAAFLGANAVATMTVLGMF